MSQPEQNKTNIYFIRHGEAFSNVHPIIAGKKGDQGLTELGVRQAQALHDRIADTGEIKPDVFIASPLTRARQTAEIISPAIQAPIQFNWDVEELRPGVADGMSVQEFHEKYGLPHFRENPFQPFAPEGENWPGFIMRVAEALNTIILEHPHKTILIVCHGGVIDASMIIFSRMHSVLFPPMVFATANTSITHWQSVGDQSSGILGTWRLMRYNDTAHLAKIGINDHVSWAKSIADTQKEQKDEHLSLPLPTEEESDTN